MMKTFYVLPLLMAAGLSVAPEANALTVDNGRNVNGRNINGSSLNGRNLNGLAFNGRNMNGRNLNGLSFNGTAREEAAGHATTVILKDGERVTLE
jgi:hypothetical protein